MSDLCLRCGYSVTEPICASCLINEIQNWLHDQNLKKEYLKIITKEFGRMLSQVESWDYVLVSSSNLWNLSVMPCNNCKKEMYVLCSYCVINQAFLILKNNLTDKHFLDSFKQIFNTTLYERN